MSLYKLKTRIKYTLLITIKYLYNKIYHLMPLLIFILLILFLPILGSPIISDKIIFFKLFIPLFFFIILIISLKYYFFNNNKDFINNFENIKNTKKNKEKRVFKEEDRTFNSFEDYINYKKNINNNDNYINNELKIHLNRLELTESFNKFDLKKQYKLIAKQWHPDIKNGVPLNIKNEQMKKINESYNYLKKYLNN